MSTQQPPGSSRRRRIAGERRGRVNPEDQQSSLAPPPVVKPPAPSKPSTPAKRPTEQPVEDQPVAPADETSTRKSSKRPVGLTEKAGKKAGKSSASSGATSVPVTRQPVVSSDRSPDRSEEKAPSTSSRWWGSRASLLILSAVLVALLALAGLLALGLLGTDGVQDVNEADAVDESVRTAPAAAESAATAILAYDFRSLDADQDTASRFMTEDFAKEYADTFEKVVRPAAEETRAKVTASVLATSVVRATEDTARVLLFVDQATTSTANARPQIALNRVEMSLVREGDEWRVDDISSF